MGLVVYQTNAFTDIPYGGKPVTIIPDASNLTETDIKKIAKVCNSENLSFIIKEDEKNFRVRFFKKQDEVKFCGRSTIANFYTLAEQGYIDINENGVTRVYQKTNIGINPIDIISSNGELEKVEMYKDSPVLVKTYDEHKLDAMAGMMGLKRKDIGHFEEKVLPELVYTEYLNIVVPLKTEELLKIAKPDILKLQRYLKRKAISKDKIVKIQIFTITRSEKVKCRQFEISKNKMEEISCSGSASIATIFYIIKNNLMESKEICLKQGKEIDRPSEIYCTMNEQNKEYPIKVGGKGRVFIEGVLKY